MTILPQGLKTKQQERLYKETKRIQETIQKKQIKNCKLVSMGMSKDYEIAATSGATHVRIGTALYGKRK